MIWIAISTVICAILYRAGGMSKDATAEPTWMPMWLRQSWVRDWIIPVVIYLTCAVCRWPSDWLAAGMLLAAVLPTGGALSTYWDELFGFDNFWFSGFVVGLAAFPLIWAGYHWYWILARALVLAVLWGGWSAIVGKDTWEEYGRGAFVAATLPLMMI